MLRDLHYPTENPLQAFSLSRTSDQALPPAASAEEVAATALVVGYRPGLDSCIAREE
jgi:hypothetical protein